MKSCMGCFLFLMVIASISALIQGVSFVLVNYWAPILGFSGAWISHRYVKSWYAEVEE